MRLVFLVILTLGVQSVSFAQETAYKIVGIGFYNFENLFDTLDAPDIRDEEFTPAGDKLYGTDIYIEKMANLAKVVHEIGMDITPDGLAILGVSEIENRKVLEDFVAHPTVSGRDYQIVHYDSPDRRGIDVALLYQPKYFEVLGSQALPVILYDEDEERKYTRDVLHVAGLMDGDTLHVLVNHWPSRSGGEKASRPYRNAAAAVCKSVIDSLCQVNPDSKVVLMGDLNDDPISPSVKEVLNAQRKPHKVRECGLYNPMWEMYRKGYGTLAYRDAWSLFDQIIVSEGLLKEHTDTYFYHQAYVFKKRYMVQKTGRYKGYPFRAFSFDTFQGGYSDHFPVYIFLLREVKK